MPENIVHIWAREPGGPPVPANREQADDLLARLRAAPPSPGPGLPAFARHIEREVLCYYPDHPELVAALGQMQQRVREAGSAVLSLALPASDLALAVRLLLKHAQGVYCYFEPGGMLYTDKSEPGVPVDGFPLMAEAAQWRAECKAFPASLDEARQRAAALLAAPLHSHGFACAQDAKGDLTLERKTAGAILQRLRVEFSRRYGRPQIQVSTALVSEALQALSRESGVTFPAALFIHLDDLVACWPGPVRALGSTYLFSWEDVVDISRFIERTLVPLLDRYDSVSGFDAYLGGHLAPEWTVASVESRELRLAVAHLAGNPDYEAIRSHWLRQVEGRATPQAENLRRLATFLASRAPGAMPSLPSGPDALPLDRQEVAAAIAARLRKRLRDLGFKKKASRSYVMELVRDAGELRQSLHLSLNNKDGRWGFRLGIAMSASPDLPLSKTVKKPLGELRVFFRNLDDMLIDDFDWIGSWTEFEARMDDREPQIRDWLQGIDSLAAVQAAFYQASSPRYSAGLLWRNWYGAYTLAALLGGPEAEAIKATVLAALDAIEDDAKRAYERDFRLAGLERSLKRALKALQAEAAT